MQAAGMLKISTSAGLSINQRGDERDKKSLLSYQGLQAEQSYHTTRCSSLKWEVNEDLSSGSAAARMALRGCAHYT
jgi:hypothetical protein